MRVAGRSGFRLGLALGVLCLGRPSYGDPPKPAAPVPRRLDAALATSLSEAVTTATGGAFWGVVLVARQGEVVYEEGWGTSDYAGERANDATTLFELASASKQVTATAVLRLEQQRRLKTTDPVTKFFPKAPADKRAVTIDHLLHHTAGLSDELGVPYAWTGARAEYVTKMLSPPLVRKPGEAFAYSNVGYALLAAVVEEVTGGPFETYCRKELFAPAGLRDTGFVRDPALVGSPRAARRACDDCAPTWTASDWFYGWGYRGMGGVVSTADDLVRWDRALRTDAVLAAPARTKLFQPGLGGYACGWMVETTDRGTTKAHHAGGVRGFAVQVARWLEDDVVVVVLSDGASDVHAVAQTVAHRLFPPPPLVASFDLTGKARSRYGAFLADTGFAVAVEREGKEVALVVRHGGQVVARVSGPRGVAGRLAADVERALAASSHPAPDEPAAIGGGVYLNQLGAASEATARVEAGLAFQVMPRYRGRAEDGSPVEDLRLVLVLVHQDRGWPLMLQLNPAAARALLAALR